MPGSKTFLWIFAVFMIIFIVSISTFQVFLAYPQFTIIPFVLSDKTPFLDIYIGDIRYNETQHEATVKDNNPQGAIVTFYARAIDRDNSSNPVNMTCNQKFDHTTRLLWNNTNPNKATPHLRDNTSITCYAIDSRKDNETNTITHICSLHQITQII